jgi:hypothetical protein
VQPRRRPQQLGAVPARRGVVLARHRDAAVVPAPVLVGEIEQLQTYFHRVRQQSW